MAGWEDSERSLPTLVEIRESQRVILSPATGLYSGCPVPHTVLSGRAGVGRLKVLNSYYDLCLPQDVHGQVMAGEEKDLIVPVMFGQELFCLTTVSGFKEATVASPEGTNQEDGTGEDSGFVVRAFTPGIFYARPGPAQQPYVTQGQEIEKGKTLGLIEAMKTFNHIVFHGTPSSDRGKIEKVFVQDAQEVKRGQALFLIT